MVKIVIALFNPALYFASETQRVRVDKMVFCKALRIFLKFLKRFNYPPSINCKKGVRIVLRRRWFNCKRVFSYLFVTSFNSLMYNVPFFHCFFFLSFHHDWATLILFYFCPVFARGPTNRIFSLMAQKHKNQIDIVKGVLISETFLIWLKSFKKMPNHYPEHLG